MYICIIPNNILWLCLRMWNWAAICCCLNASGRFSDAFPIIQSLDAPFIPSFLPTLLYVFWLWGIFLQTLFFHFVKVIIARLMGVQSTALGFHRHTRRHHPVLEFQGWWGHTPVLVVLQYAFTTSHVHLQQMSYVKICHDLHVQFLHEMIWNSGDESMPRSFFTIICFHCPDPFLCIEFVQWLDVFVNISKPPTIKTIFICDPSMLPLIKPIFPTRISIIDPLIPIKHHFPVLPIHSHCFAHRKYTDHHLPIVSPWKTFFNIQHIRISHCSHPHSSPFIFEILFKVAKESTWINVSTAFHIVSSVFLLLTYPLVNKHRPWKSPIFNGNWSFNPYLPGSMLIYCRINHFGGFPLLGITKSPTPHDLDDPRWHVFPVTITSRYYTDRHWKIIEDTWYYTYIYIYIIWYVYI